MDEKTRHGTAAKQGDTSTGAIRLESASHGPWAMRPLVCLLLALAPATARGESPAIRDARQRMVDEEIVAAGVTNERVIRAMRTTPRHEFVPRRLTRYAYLDMALPIGERQTISPPFVVAYMTQEIDPQPTDRVLEIGTGSGYQAAVLSPLVDQVYTIEIVESLASKAARTLQRLKYTNVHTKAGDGYLGWPENAPFDKIIVTCSPEDVPEPLVAQLKEGGLMIVPVGRRYQQNLYLMTKKEGRLESKAMRPTLFVPMTGQAERERSVAPDPIHPAIANGSFEESVAESDRPAAWHYLRQMDRIADENQAREGTHYVTFRNADPGRGSRALQGFAVDGRQVTRLDVRLWVKAEKIRFGQTRDQWPRLVITYYDEQRRSVGQASMGPWRGSFGWREERARLPVPVAAREAILRIGLLGAVGQISIDHIQLQKVEK